MSLHPLVLVAEDDDDLRRALCDGLKDYGLDVVEVPDGKAVQSYIDGCLNADGSLWPRVHVLVTDLRMPGMSGLELLSYLRDSDYSLPVIVVTAFGDAKTREQARDFGAHAVLQKPFDLDELVSVVDAVLPRSQVSRFGVER